MRLSVAWDHAVIATCKLRRRAGEPISARLEEWATQAEAAIASRRYRERKRDKVVPAAPPPPPPRYRWRTVAQQRAAARAWVMGQP